jgi:hypothetical protein
LPPPELELSKDLPDFHGIPAARKFAAPFRLVSVE